MYRTKFFDHLILIAGGLFLIWKATNEIHANVAGEHPGETTAAGVAGTTAPRFSGSSTVEAARGRPSSSSGTKPWAVSVCRCAHACRTLPQR